MAIAGRVMMLPKGAYDASATYGKLDIVTYDGAAWVARQDVSGIAPVEGEYWMKLVSDGDGGGAGTDVRQSLTEDTALRPLLLSQTTITDDTVNVDDISYRANSVYADPGQGELHALGFVSDAVGESVRVESATAEEGVTLGTAGEELHIGHAKITHTSEEDELQVAASNGVTVTAPSFKVEYGTSAMSFDSGGLTVPSLTVSDGSVVTRGALLNLVYPVGSIYMSVNSTSPATLFGGTWTALQNRVLIGAGSAHEAGATGGAESVKLTVSNLPSHNHSLTINSTGQTMSSAGSHAHVLPINRSDSEQNGFSLTTSAGGFTDRVMVHTGTYTGNINTNSVGGHTHTLPAHTHSGTIGNTGGNVALSTMPPYLSVYMWKRTA